MGNGQPNTRAFLCGALLFPLCSAAGEPTSASASARITLKLPARVERLRADSGGEQLCLSAIPAERYYLLISPDAGNTEDGSRLSGQSSSYCVPLVGSADTGLVTVVAQ